LSWTAPSGDSSIDHYVVYQNGIDVIHTSATSVTITGLNNEENYSFAVAAHNTGGVGILSAAKNISPSSSDVGVSGSDNLAYLSIALALLIAAIIGAIIVVRRNRKK
jgi:chitodextrinase